MINNSARAVKDYPARSNRYAILCLFLLFLFGAGFGRQVVIVAVPEGNKIVTADGDTLRLANVQTVSINDPDSLRRALALKARAFLEKHVLNQSAFVEYAKDDSIRLVHIWRKKEGASTVNSLLLKKGYGYFVPEPNSRLTVFCRDAAEYAKTNYFGVHRQNHSQIFIHGPDTTSAFWLNAGAGMGKGRRGAVLAGDIAMRYRHHHWLYSIGYSESLDREGVDKYKSIFLMIGAVEFNRHFETSISTGTAITRRTYSPEYMTLPEPSENRPSVIRYPAVLLWVFQAQCLMHPFSSGPALGVSINCNFNSEVTFVLFSLNVAMGEWNF